MPLPEALTLLDNPPLDDVPTYWYEGQCPQTGAWLKLPRTTGVEAIAQSLMQHLDDPIYQREGKMYGVLLVQTATGQWGLLKAFSGLLNGQSELPGWVPPIAGREQVAQSEAETIAMLDAIKTQLWQLHQIPERQQYEALQQLFEQKLQQLSEVQRQRKELRSQAREQHPELSEKFDIESRHEGIEKRNLKRQRDQSLQPLIQIIQVADARMRDLKQQRKRLSRQLQTQLHQASRLTNFLGETMALTDLIHAMPTGTGECCAPKLLNYAAIHCLQPVAMAEFWWGSANSGQFHGACVDRCQPLMGFLLSGLNPLPRVYEDDWLVAIDKPAGLLSVRGRTLHACVLDRLPFLPVHRLDQDTSGILLLAKDRDSYRRLSQQFELRQVTKIYEAVLQGKVTSDRGRIELPLGSRDRPRQKVDWQQGKPSLTHYRVLARTETTTRIEFQPLTGRTHQLRVHAAEGLGAAIVGDRLYGRAAARLHLHARELQFRHPQTGALIHLQVPTPF